MARSAVIQKTKLQSHPNSVFFPSNNEKRKIYAHRDFLKRERSKPEHKAPKRYIESGDKQSAPDTSYLYLCQPRQQICPAAADNPGWMRWSPEDGEGGLRRVLLPRPLVRRKATIKSTEAMRYSSLKKPKQTTKAKRSFLIKANPNPPTASQKPRASGDKNRTPCGVPFFCHRSSR